MMSWLEKRGLSLEIIDDTDHIFAPVWSQERAVGLLTEFVDRIARTRRPQNGVRGAGVSREHDRVR
jgi:hypothetical protein